MENKEIDLKVNQGIENFFDMSIEESKEELQSLQLMISENEKKMKVKKVVDVILYPLTLVIDVVMMPVRMVKIIRNIDFVVSYVKDEQIAKLHGMVMKNDMFSHDQYIKMMIDDFIHKNMKLNLMDKDLVDKYDLHSHIFNKEVK